MIVLAYYNSNSEVTRYEVLQAAPSTLPSNSVSIPMANVPDAFFESFSDYKVSGSSLVANGTATKRIIAVTDLDATTQAKFNALKWARERLVKTSVFGVL